MSGAIPAGRRPYLIVAGVMVLLHLLLLLHDLSDAAGFFRADRAQQRFGTLQALLAAVDGGGDIVAALTKNGNIGDYGLHALLYLLGGTFAVTVFQTSLAVPAALCVVYIAARAGASPRVAMAAGLLYGLLPQSLAFPHQFLSEAFSNPFLIFGVALLLRAQEGASRAVQWLLAGLFFGGAGLVRPALILLPVIAAVLAAVFREQGFRWTKLGAFAVASFVPFVACGTFMFSQTGKFGFGDSHQDLGINFSQSTAKVLLSEGVSGSGGSPPDWLPERISLGQYLGFVRTHPLGFANLYTKNTIVLLADSGIGRLYVDLLGFGAETRQQLQDPVTGWRAQLTNHGLLAMLQQGLRVSPGAIIAGVLGALGFALLNVGIAAAYISLLRFGSPLRNRATSPQTRWALAFLLMLPLYVLTTSQVVAYAPSRLRSQGEFAWAVLACFGWALMQAWWVRKRYRRMDTASGTQTR
jgi:4-amino-4-deoxy-L-arabinose transferase-like glycosyltransferase